MIEHPTIEELVAYPLGALPAERSRQVWQHCSGCSECGNELAAIILVRSAAITEEAAEHPREDRSRVEPLREDRPGEKRSRENWKYLAIAASIVATIGIGWMSLRLLRGPSDGQLAGTRAPAVPADPDYAALATRETLPQTHLHFRFGMATPAAGTHRGRVREGVQAIVDGRYDEAESSLRALMLESPSEETAVYLGIAMYLRGDLSDEAANLLSAADPAGGSLGRAGHWYLANLFVARGEIGAARPILERLGAREGTDRWGRRAQGLLERLEGF